ncbi:MAG: protein arginine kinase [Planctomycetales bacterium 4484_123]|nr:MAG: protein arginine kinase [Planctomycetales bacterium 4484_123]
MNLADLIRRPPQWRRSGGPMSDVVFSSRVRLARNLAGMPFLTRCTETQLSEVAGLLRGALMRLSMGGETLYVDLAATDAVDRQLLVERHLISKQLAETDIPRGVAIAGDETVAVMVNEEDHLRVQVLRGGLRLDACYGEIRRLDEMLEGQLSFAFSSRFGYLTACPTNVGTGLRVSVMMHLPALRLTGKLETALRAARDMHLAVRGLYGEGTEALGDMFQLSNQVTLGRSEEQIVADFRDEVVPVFIDYERQARKALLEHRRMALHDKVHRALAVLRSARLISSEEALQLLSYVRLGLSLEILDGLGVEDINELGLVVQPAHLQKLYDKRMSSAERAEARAALLRQRLGGQGAVD